MDVNVTDLTVCLLSISLVQQPQAGNIINPMNKMTHFFTTNLPLLFVPYGVPYGVGFDFLTFVT
jgi:putative effector of murein hydrolase LrgA (UPF0299 family)